MIVLDSIAYTPQYICWYTDSCPIISIARKAFWFYLSHWELLLLFKLKIYWLWRARLEVRATRKSLRHDRKYIVYVRMHKQISCRLAVYFICFSWLGPPPPKYIAKKDGVGRSKSRINSKLNQISEIICRFRWFSDGCSGFL